MPEEAERAVLRRICEPSRRLLQPRSLVCAVPKHLLLLAACLWLGTLWHEAVGHGLVGLICGGRIADLHVLGLDMYPVLRWVGWQGQYGHCGVVGVRSPRREAVESLGGSVSTYLVAVGAHVLLLARRWGAVGRLILAYLGIWWIDMLTYTLPTWGVRRSILWGGFYSEPYRAAVELGVPGLIFQGFVVSTSALMAAALVHGMVRRLRFRR